MDVKVVYDDYPDEIHWYIVRTSETDDGCLIATFDPSKHEVERRAENTESFCLEEGQYRFTIHDDAGDGLCCGLHHGQDGYYSVSSHGKVLVKGDNFVGSVETSVFDLHGDAPTSPRCFPDIRSKPIVCKCGPLPQELEWIELDFYEGYSIFPSLEDCCSNSTDYYCA